MIHLLGTVLKALILLSASHHCGKMLLNTQHVPAATHLGFFTLKVKQCCLPPCRITIRK